MSVAVWHEPGNWNNNNDRHVDFTVEPSAPTESDIMSESEDERMRLRYIGCRRESSRNSDHIDTEIISDGCRPPLPFHQRPGGRRRSISAEDNATFWNRVFSSRDSEEIDSEEAQDRFKNFAKKKWCYGTQPAKKGVIDQIEHSVAITCELYTFIESRQSYTRHKAIKDLDNIDFSLSEDKPNIWNIKTTRPPPFPPNPIRQRVEYPGTSKIIGCDRCEGVCRIPCVNCGGAGHKDCWNCNGDGVVKNTRVHYAHQDGAAGPQSMERCVTEACSICGGRGRETCANCGGAAQIPCDKCLQQGKVREYEEVLIEWLTVYDYEVIGDAPVPAEWIAKRKNKLVRMAEQKELKPFSCDSLPILTNVSEGLIRAHKAQIAGKRIHRQRLKILRTPLHTVNYVYKRKPYVYVIAGYDKKVYTAYYPQNYAKYCDIM